MPSESTNSSASAAVCSAIFPKSPDIQVARIFSFSGSNSSLTNTLFPEIRAHLLEFGNQVNTFLGAQVDDIDSLLLKPVHTALGVDAVTDNHLAKAELIDQATAVPAWGERGDQNRVMPGRAPAGSPKSVRLPVKRAVALLHQTVVPGT